LCTFLFHLPVSYLVGQGERERESLGNSLFISDKRERRRCGISFVDPLSLSLLKGRQKGERRKEVGEPEPADVKESLLLACQCYILSPL
jgi:hypothetical protein